MPTYGWILIAAAFVLVGLLVGVVVSMRRRLHQVLMSQAMREARLVSRLHMSMATSGLLTATDLPEKVEESSEGDTTPDLLELSENENTGNAVRQLEQGFDSLFLRLGPPPEGSAGGLQPTQLGGGTSDDT